jgi:hypothetical protein
VFALAVLPIPPVRARKSHSTTERLLLSMGEFMVSDMPFITHRTLGKFSNLCPRKPFISTISIIHMDMVAALPDFRYRQRVQKD